MAPDMVRLEFGAEARYGARHLHVRTAADAHMKTQLQNGRNPQLGRRASTISRQVVGCGDPLCMWDVNAVVDWSHESLRYSGLRE